MQFLYLPWSHAIPANGHEAHDKSPEDWEGS